MTRTIDWPETFYQTIAGPLFASLPMWKKLLKWRSGGAPVAPIVEDDGAMAQDGVPMVENPVGPQTEDELFVARLARCSPEEFEELLRFTAAEAMRRADEAEKEFTKQRGFAETKTAMYRAAEAKRQEAARVKAAKEEARCKAAEEEALKCRAFAEEAYLWAAQAEAERSAAEQLASSWRMTEEKAKVLAAERETRRRAAEKEASECRAAETQAVSNLVQEEAKRRVFEQEAMRKAAVEEAMCWAAHKDAKSIGCRSPDPVEIFLSHCASPSQDGVTPSEASEAQRSKVHTWPDSRTSHPDSNRGLPGCPMACTCQWGHGKGSSRRGRSHTQLFCSGFSGTLNPPRAIASKACCSRCANPILEQLAKRNTEDDPQKAVLQKEPSEPLPSEIQDQGRCSDLKRESEQWIAFWPKAM